MGVNLLDVLSRATQEGLESYVKTKPQLDEAALRRLETQINFMHTLAGGDPDVAYQMFGDRYLNAVKQATGIEIPTRELPITELRPTEETVEGFRVMPKTAPTLLERFRAGERGEPFVPKVYPTKETRTLLQEVQTGTRRELALPRRPGAFTIRTYDGRDVPVDVFKGLPAEFIMHIVRGPQAAQQIETYGDWLGENVRPEWRNVLVRRDANGEPAFPPTSALIRPLTPTERRAEERAAVITSARRAYAEELARSGDPTKAWAAAGRIAPDVFRPELTTSQQALRIQAIDVYNQAVAAGEDSFAAWNRAYAVDPTYPRPYQEEARAATWRKFLTQGAAALNPEERRYVEAQLRESGEDAEFTEAMRVITSYARIGDRTPQEQALYARALQTISSRWGVTAEELRTKPLPWWQSVINAVWPFGAPFKAELVGPSDATAWAESEYPKLKAEAQKRGVSIMRLFNMVRAKDKDNRTFNADYWRALYQRVLRGG